MNKDFKNEIIQIAKNRQDQDNYKPQTFQHSSEDKEYIEVIEHFFSISKEAVDIYNANSTTDILNVYKLPKEFLEMFLEIPGRRAGFCIISPTKLVIFFDEDPRIITVIGKTRSFDRNNNSSSKVNQLLKVSFSKKDQEYQYKDNAGGVLDPYDIVALLIKWVVS
ncbi:MAG: hypothetical protein DHS20C13_06990 [Thermodesulfobacteriota bacterium]|nr:MAG: hypothetical protein DHS20C13_06990 [Thermodesulfobacteriota bacterium]